MRAGVTYKAVASNDYGIIGTNAATSTYALGSPLSVTTDNSEKAAGASVSAPGDTHSSRKRRQPLTGGAMSPQPRG